jgi:hypothetical protein
MSILSSMIHFPGKVYVHRLRTSAQGLKFIFQHETKASVSNHLHYPGPRATIAPITHAINHGKMTEATNRILGRIDKGHSLLGRRQDEVDLFIHGSYRRQRKSTLHPSHPQPNPSNMPQPPQLLQRRIP